MSVRERRLERYNQIIELHRQSVSQRENGGRLHMEWKAVRRFLRAGSFQSDPLREQGGERHREPGANIYAAGVQAG